MNASHILCRPDVDMPVRSALINGTDTGVRLKAGASHCQSPNDTGSSDAKKRGHGQLLPAFAGALLRRVCGSTIAQHFTREDKS